MAVAQMKKVVVIGWKQQAEDTLSFLQSLGLLQIEKIPANLITELALTTVDNEEKVRELQFRIAKVQYCLTFLQQFLPPSGGLLANFMKTRVKTSYREYEAVLKQVDLDFLYNECEALEDNLADLNNHLKEVRDKQALLRPWQNLGVAGADLKETANFKIVALSGDRKGFQQLQNVLTAKKVNYDLTVINELKQKVFAVLIWLKVKSKLVEQALAAANLTLVDLSSYNQSPAQLLADLTAEEQKTEKLILEYTQKGQELSQSYSSLTIILDYLNNQLAKSKALGLLSTTAASYVFSGWVEADKEAELAAKLNQAASVVDYFFEEPQPGEQPPVVLKNHWLVKPFEAITRMYGLPNYYEMDPTPVMAPFFFLFFGLALGDAGYGLVLFILMQLLKRRLTVTEAGRSWLDLFSYGGIAAIIVGIFTGGYFGIEAAKLPAILRKAIIVDPLNQAVILLLFSWMIGVVQVASGLTIEFVDSLRAKQWAEAFYDHFASLFLLLSAAIFAGVWLGEQIFKTKSALLTQVGQVGSLLTVTAVIFFLLAKGRLLSFLGEKIKKLPQAVTTKNLAVLADIFILALVVLILALSWLSLLSLSSVFIFLGLALVLSSTVRGVFLRLMQAFYELYGMTSYLGDILSYSRLMALGLVSVLIGFVINVMVGLVVGLKIGPLPLGILLGIMLAVPLHILNLLISLLGAFVHPLRLQYVEFFSKFYANGGQAFTPLKIEAENIYFASEKK